MCSCHICQVLAVKKSKPGSRKMAKEENMYVDPTRGIKRDPARGKWLEY